MCEDVNLFIMPPCFSFKHNLQMALCCLELLECSNKCVKSSSSVSFILHSHLLFMRKKIVLKLWGYLEPFTIRHKAQLSVGDYLELKQEQLQYLTSFTCY